MGLLVRLGPFVLLALVLVGIWLVRRNRKRQASPPVQETILSPGAAQAAVNPIPEVIWPPDVTLPEGDDAEAKLDKDSWNMLLTVLNGEGPGMYSQLLRRDGRFRTRDGGRYTLYRATAKLNGAMQDVCVIVRIKTMGHVTARRMVVSMKRPEVRFIDEPRDESGGNPKGISYAQAVDTRDAGMCHMSSSAALLLAHELTRATRYGDL